jgi:hypothetical protein
MTDAPENRLRRLTAAAKAVEPADGIPAAAKLAPPLQASRLVRGHIHSSIGCRVGWTLLLRNSPVSGRNSRLRRSLVVDIRS